MYLKLKVLSQDSRLPLHLPHRSCLWGRLGSTWRGVNAHVQRALLQVWKRGQRLVAELTHITSCWGDYKVSYVACYVFNSVRVEFLLAFSAKLFEINLVGEVEVRKRKTNPSAFCDFHASPYLCPGRTTRTRSPTAGYTLCSDNIRTSVPETGHNTNQGLKRIYSFIIKYKSLRVALT